MAIKVILPRVFKAIKVILPNLNERDDQFFCIRSSEPFLKISVTTKMKRTSLCFWIYYFIAFINYIQRNDQGSTVATTKRLANVLSNDLEWFKVQRPRAFNWRSISSSVTWSDSPGFADAAAGARDIDPIASIPISSRTLNSKIKQWYGKWML